jgi:hypothetical protein
MKTYETTLLAKGVNGCMFVKFVFIKKSAGQNLFVLVNLYIEKGWPSLDLSLFLALRTNDNQ